MLFAEFAGPVCPEKQDGPLPPREVAPGTSRAPCDGSQTDGKKGTSMRIHRSLSFAGCVVMMSLIVACGADSSATSESIANASAPISLSQGGRVTDVSGDGKADVVFLDGPSGAVVTWISSGNGFYSESSFASGVDTCLTCGTWQLADVDGDHKTDLVHLTGNPGAIVTWLSNGDGTYDPIWFTSTADTCLSGCGSWQAGDVNGDGKSDLIHVTTNPGAVTSWLSDGHGGYHVVWYTSTSDSALQNGNGLIAADANGDGRTDLVHVTSNAGAVVTWLSNGDGTFRPTWYTSASDTCMVGCGTWQFGDVNGDGRSDLIHVTTNAGTVATWFSDGSGGYRVVWFTTTIDTQLQNGNGLTAADANGDGRMDLVHVTSNPGAVVTWFSNGDGSYRPIWFTSSTAPTCSSALACGDWQFGDVSGDRRTDLVNVYNASANTWLSNGDGTYSVVHFTTIY